MSIPKISKTVSIILNYVLLKTFKKELIFFSTTIFSIVCIYSQSNKNFTTLKIKPSLTDSTITSADAAHFIAYNNNKVQKQLLVFLPGTNGIPEKGPMQLFKTAINQGLPVINLSYSNTIAVARICKGENLKNDSECTRKFREKRVFGTNTTALISDESQDAIVNRLHKLLIYLVKHDSKGNWDNYLNNGAINWKKILMQKWIAA